NLDLRNTTGRWRNAYQFELTQTPIARGDFAFALQDMNFDRRLVINHGRKRQAVAQGIVELRSIIFVNNPPRVSKPRLSGSTSSSTMSFTSPVSTPPWIAAPT